MLRGTARFKSVHTLVAEGRELGFDRCLIATGARPSVPPGADPRTLGTSEFRFTAVIDVSRRNGLAWDAIISCEMIGVYKPHLQAYATAVKWLNLEPAHILMVACHNFDLNAAHKAGFRAAFIRRPDEWGPEGPPDPHPNMPYDLVEDGFDGLVRSVLT